MSNRSRATTVLVLFISAAACGPLGAQDGGAQSDAGAVDSGMAADAGGAPADAGVPDGGVNADAGFVCPSASGTDLRGRTDSSLTFTNRAGTIAPFSIYLPPGYDTGSARYPVVYHLHGKGLNSGHSGNQVKNVSANFEAALCSPGLGISPLIVVFPDGHAAETDGASGWSNSGPGVTPYVPAEDDVHDLIAFIDAHYRTKADNQHRAMQGFSMGAGGAAKFVTRYPERFCAWVGYDGPLNPWEDVNQAHYGNSEAFFDANGNPWHLLDVNRAAIASQGVRFRQVVTSMVSANETFRAALVSAGLTAITVEPEYHDYSDVVTAPAHDLRKAMDANGTDSWVFLQTACGL